MFKTIPQSNIANKRFKVYKEWVQTQSDVPVLVAQSETGSGAFDENTASQTDGVYTSPLWHSLNAKYYSTNGNVFTQTGIIENPGEFSIYRDLPPTAYVIRVDQVKIGEQMKRYSVKLTDTDTGDEYVDNGFGRLTSQIPVYGLVSYDAQTQDLVLEEPDGTQHAIVLSQLDLNTGIGIFTYDGDTNSYIVVEVDFETGNIRLSEDFNFNTLQPSKVIFGNVFYDEGLIVLTVFTGITNYRLEYLSTVTIHETEVLVSVEPGEFNYSQNPTAVEVSLRTQYEFQTTAIANSRPAGTVVIKEIDNITQRQFYSGSFGSNTGSWDDYHVSASTDPTGSYLTPYITTIGLYDNNYDLVAVAKLATPIKNLPDYSLNFIIRLDV